MDDPIFPHQLTIAPGASRTLEAPGHGIGGYLWSAEVEGPGRIEDISIPAIGDIGTGATGRFRLTWLGSQSGSVILRLKRPWEDVSIESHRIEIRSGDDEAH